MEIKEKGKSGLKSVLLVSGLEISRIQRSLDLTLRTKQRKRKQLSSISLTRGWLANANILLTQSSKEL